MIGFGRIGCAVLCAVLGFRCVLAGENNWPTPLEISGFSRNSTTSEISMYLRGLAAAEAGLARVELLGRSVEGRPLELLRLTGPRVVEPVPRLRVLIIGSQHGGAEPAGGEALTSLARELLTEGLRPLLKDLDLFLLSNANPDGRDLKRRANAHRVNLNTDFVLLSQPESQALKIALDRYRPDVVLDVHESAVLKRDTLAREGYVTDFDAQFDVASNPAIPSALRAYAQATFLPALLAETSRGGLTAQRYLGEITHLHQPVTNGGLTLRNFRNAAGMTGALSVLLETKLDPRIDSYPTYRNLKVRVDRQLRCLRAFLTLVAAHRAEIKAQTRVARAALQTEDLVLSAAYVKDPLRPMVRLPMRRLDTRQREVLAFPDHRRLVIGAAAPLPQRLLITAHTALLQPILARQQIRCISANSDQPVSVTAPRLSPRSTDVGSPEAAAEVTTTVALPPGSLRVDLNQLNGRLAAVLLDPRAPGSLFDYPAFKALLRPGEAFFIYRVGRQAPRNVP